MPRRRRLLGRRRARQRSATSPPLHDAGVFGFKCFLVDSGVPEFPPLTPGRAGPGAGRGRRPRRAADRARRGRRDHRPRAPQRGDDVRGLPRLAARRRPRTARSRGADRRGPSGRRPGARPAPVRPPTRCRCSPRPRAAGVAVTVETCPHYLTLTAEEVPDGATRVQVLPADPRRRPTGTRSGRAWPTARSTASSPTTRRPPPDLKARTPATSARPGAASPRSSSACRCLDRGPRSAATPSTTSSRWMSRGAGRPRRARRQGRASRRADDADLVVFAPDETFTVDPARLHHRHPRHAVRRQDAARRRPRHLAARAARGRPTARSTPSRAGRLLTEGRRDERLHRAARPGLPHPGRQRVRGERRVLRPAREPDPAASRRRRCTRSATRARSTTAGRPAAGASPAPTGRSCGSACPASCTGSSWTPRTSSATTRRTSRSRRPSSRAIPSAAELAAPGLGADPRQVTGRRRDRQRLRRRPTDRVWTHVRLSIHPDGGVARFRVHGTPVPDPRFLTGTVDLAGAGERRLPGRLLATRSTGRPRS